MKAKSILTWTLFYGVTWNVIGWVGNNLVLGGAWRALDPILQPDFSPPYSGIAREAMTLVPDFLFAFGFVWLFAQFRVRTVMSSLALALMMEVFVAIVYLAIITSGFLPWQIAVQTSVLALLIFLATAPLLPLALRRGTSPAIAA